MYINRRIKNKQNSQLKVFSSGTPLRLRHLYNSYFVTIMQLDNYSLTVCLRALHFAINCVFVYFTWRNTLILASIYYNDIHAQCERHNFDFVLETTKKTKLFIIIDNSKCMQISAMLCGIICIGSHERRFSVIFKWLPNPFSQRRHVIECL